jgi:monovalent cation/hydrogen antiporter
MDTAEIVVLLLASIAALAVLAQRLAIPYPILLVLGGLAISFIPGLPEVRMSPPLVLLIFLPPLLYAQAWMTPWREFWRYRRPIFLLAVGLVLFTTMAVAFAAHALMGLPLAAVFVLGAIVSPPDAVAASAIAERCGLPRRVVMVLEGESLVNDATGLVAYKFAVAAVVTGTFSLGQAGVHFVVGAIGGVALGWVVGWGSAHMFARIKDEAALITLSLLVPYVGYLAAERLGVSGVLAAVTSGLYLGWRAPQMLTASTRLQAGAFWDMLLFLLNSIVFLLIGLQLPSIRANLSGYSLSTLAGYAVVTCLVVILIRPIWVFPGAYLPRWFSRRIRETEVDPGWRNVLIVGWSGMRGVVLPTVTASGEQFPGRDLVVFLTFAVILGTLVGQGLTLAPLIKWLDVRPDHHGEKEELKTRLALAEAAQLRLAQLAQEARLPESAVNALRVKYDNRIAHLTDEQAHVLGWSSRREELVAGRRLRREALAAERKKLLELRHRGEVADELLHKLQHELDLDEARIN